MTAARPERKAHRWAGVFSAAIALFALPGLVAATEMVVVNRHTGLAIDGFDPVAYFTDAVPKLGRGQWEWQSAGATWRFANEGNRAAFVAAPDVYRPRFGGHDPVALARGAAAAGHPKLWLIERKRLYLFYSEAARVSFSADPDAAIAAAERHWPEVQRTLAP